MPEKAPNAGPDGSFRFFFFAPCQGVIATAKHFVLNNQETNRTSVSAQVDERTRFEIYYMPFEGAIKAEVGSMMCSCQPPPPALLPSSCPDSLLWLCRQPHLDAHRPAWKL